MIIMYCCRWCGRCINKDESYYKFEIGSTGLTITFCKECYERLSELNA